MSHKRAHIPGRERLIAQMSLFKLSKIEGGPFVFEFQDAELKRAFLKEIKDLKPDCFITSGLMIQDQGMTIWVNLPTDITLWMGCEQALRTEFGAQAERCMHDAEIPLERLLFSHSERRFFPLPHAH